MPIYAIKKNTNILSKKIPRNPKFDYIEPTIDTGASLSKRLKDWEEYREDYKISKDEIFKRIKPTGFVKLILQIAEMNRSRYIDHEKIDSINNNSEIVEPIPETNRSSFDKFVRGYGELNQHEQIDEQINKSPVKEESPNPYKCPYLLLDVRLKDEFDLGHIIKAHHYSAAMLGRSCNFESPEMLCYKNKPGSVIILYDNDESIAPKAATVLVERGYENILMLSGGLKVCWKKFPRGLIAGRLPQNVQSAILATCGMSAYQMGPSHSRRSYHTNMETGSLSSDTISVDDFSRHFSRLSSEAPDLSDNKSITTTTTNRTLRSTASRYSSRRRFSVHDFEPYCEVNDRKRPDLNDEEEFIMSDLAHLSLAVQQAEAHSQSAKSVGRARTKSCGLNESHNSARFLQLMK